MIYTNFESHLSPTHNANHNPSFNWVLDPQLGDFYVGAMVGITHE